MRIAFLLPCRSPVPVGGFKVVYEYAGRLAERGHEVAVVHPRTLRSPVSPLERLKALLWVERYRRRPRSLAPWFSLDPRVELRPIAWARPAALSGADALLATTWQTAGPVLEAADGDGGFYFVQGRELDGAEEVLATWRLPLRKIVISRWLREIALDLDEGARTSCVPNGLDHDRWGVDVAVDRRPPRIGALLSPGKGREEIVAALRTMRAREPEIGASAFGTGPPPEGMPAWIEYSRLPDPAALRALYNSCSIFLQASRSEGWGLPGTESMACGCALVTCDNGGSREYAVDGETALVVDGHGAEALADATMRLVNDRDLRLALARRGRELVGKLSWERSADEFERALMRPPDGWGESR
jgi:glycosyltransferase involved in cell wall biosynthesis